MDIEVLGSASNSFSAYRTSEDEKYILLGDLAVNDGIIKYDAPKRSVTTFYG